MIHRRVAVIPLYFQRRQSLRGQSSPAAQAAMTAAEAFGASPAFSTFGKHI
jgi:hypothetical protein